MAGLYHPDARLVLGIERWDMRLFWWDEIPNFGDRLAPYLLEYYAGIPSVWSPVASADVVVTGSVLENIPPWWPGHVIGAGRIGDGRPVDLSYARVHAVRGPMSAQGLTGDFAIGDPGLLADEMVDIQTRDIELGLVPHWSDTHLAYDWRFQPYSPVVIRPWKDPLDVVRMIGRCKKIVATSLHGVILADAFGIPRRTEAADKLRTDKWEGDFFKFRDYNASVGVPFRIGETQAPKRGVVEDRKHELYDVFRAFGEL
jgi:pyruvyltransferase